MNKTIFRKANLDRVSSPEQLNDYIRTSNPSVWMILASVIILLAGALVWGTFGTLETTVSTTMVVKNGTATCYVTDKQAENIRKGMSVDIGDHKGVVVSITTNPIEIKEGFDQYAMHIGGMNIGDWYYPVTVDIPIADGSYNAQIVTDRKKPMTFVMN